MDFGKEPNPLVSCHPLTIFMLLKLRFMASNLSDGGKWLSAFSICESPLLPRLFPFRFSSMDRKDSQVRYKPFFSKVSLIKLY